MEDLKLKRNRHGVEQQQIQEPAAAVGGAVMDVAGSDVGRGLMC